MTITAVICDTREPTWVQALKFDNAMVACSKLESGDLLVTCDDGALLAIERKTASDLLGSISENRIWTQLAGIKALTPWAYLMITGELRRMKDGKVRAEGRQTGWDWAAVQGALLQAQEMGVFVIHAADNADFEPAVIRLASRSHRTEMLVPPARKARILSDAEKVLCSLPGIGLEKVIPIIEYTGSVAWALVHLSELADTEHVPGVGPGTKRAVRAVLGLKEDQELAVWSAD